MGCGGSKPDEDNELDISKHGDDGYFDSFAARTVQTNMAAARTAQIAELAHVDVAVPAAEPTSQLVLHNRKELFAGLRRAAAAAAPSEPPAALVLSCMTAYSPPPRRLILRSLDDLTRLGITAEQLKAAADPTFWAYADFDAVLASFERAPSDPERRVMGLEGVGSVDVLRQVLASGQAVLNIGHLSLAMMEGKVANGEWRWLDEPGCVMHTATAKPALLRAQVAARLHVELAVMRHDAHLQQGEGGAPAAAAAAESLGDLVIFDMDFRDVSKEVGNTKVFCQSTAKMELAPLDSLSAPIREALDTLLALELVESADI